MPRNKRQLVNLSYCKDFHCLQGQFLNMQDRHEVELKKTNVTVVKAFMRQTENYKSVQNAIIHRVMGAHRFTQCTLYCANCTGSDFFQLQFKVLVITFKALRGTGPGYLLDCLIIPSLESCHLLQWDFRIMSFLWFPLTCVTTSYW